MINNAELNPSENIFEYYSSPGLIRVRLSNALDINIYIYICSKLCKGLHEEVLKRGLDPSEPVAVLPAGIIYNILQIIQSSIHYKIYSENLSRIKNKGLLLAMMITGINQISKILDLLERSYEESDHYYLVSIDKKPSNLDQCNPIELGNMPLIAGSELMCLVKNIDLLLQMI